MEQGRGRRSSGGLGSTALREEGKKKRTARGVDSRPRLERRWLVGACPWRRAAAVDGDGGGATVELGGGPELGKRGREARGS